MKWLVVICLLICSCGPSARESKEYTIEIAQMQFTPAAITVHKGDKITFVNHDMVTHDVTEAGKAWTSASLPADASWEMTVTQSADYYCTIHPVMKGKIVVE